MASAFQVQERYFYKAEDKPRGARANRVSGLGVYDSGFSFFALRSRDKGFTV